MEAERLGGRSGGASSPYGSVVRVGHHLLLHRIPDQVEVGDFSSDKTELSGYQSGKRVGSAKISGKDAFLLGCGVPAAS